jgi:hypothetical protein
MNLEKKNQIYVRLAGGLGNQLFQLSQALILGKSVVLVSTETETQRTSQEIIRFNLSRDLNTISFQRTRLVSEKLLNLSLRSSTKDSHLFRLLRGFLKLAISATMLLELRFLSQVFISDDVGADVGELDNKTALIAGYFQSENVVSRLIELKGIEVFELEANAKHEEYKSLALNENPIILQVRLGDYLNEPNFGIPSLDFYKESLKHIRNSLPKSKIWLFSNESNLAEAYLSEVLPDNYRVINDELLTPADILQVMRLGSGYIISNSTFGWWGAYLKRDKSAPVFVPSPWFKKQQEPRGLIPKDWIRINAW